MTMNTEAQKHNTDVADTKHSIDTTASATPSSENDNLLSSHLDTAASNALAAPANSSNSFTQRLIDRGVAVPSSFTNWDKIQNRSSYYANNNHLNTNNANDDGLSIASSSVSPGAIHMLHNNGSDDSSGSVHVHTNPSLTAAATNNSNNSNGFFYDIEQHYGISPFITPSLTASDLLLPSSEGTAASHSGGSSSIPNSSSNNSNDTFFKSLRQRYEKEKKQQQLFENGFGGSAREIDQVNEEDEEEEEEEEDEEDKRVHDNALKIPSTPRQQDSDIELSEDEDHQQQQPHPILPLKTRKRTKESVQPLALGQLKEEAAEDEPVTLSPTVERVKRLLFTKPALLEQPQQPTEEAKPTLLLPPSSAATTTAMLKKPAASLPSPPRKYLLQAPVFQVVNANTVKDRYLFLFNDLLLICKPIMDENIITTTNISPTTASQQQQQQQQQMNSKTLHINSGRSLNINNNGGNHSPEGNGNIVINSSRYRFRPNENSLFQVKNIVQLANLTLYITKDDYYSLRQHHQNIAADNNDGRPGSALPPPTAAPQPRLKIHPILASALRRFENNAASGIAYLINKRVLTQDPLSIANFLFKTPDLNRRQLGYYLSDPEHEHIYDAFLECFRLSGLKLDEALRILLTTFRLPSNWESLEYLVEKFAKKWHDANQNVIKFHEDMVVKVVVATLFLNAEYWYDAASERDVFWYARELKERQDRQAKRKMSMMVINNNGTGSFHPLSKAVVDGNQSGSSPMNNDGSARRAAAGQADEVNGGMDSTSKQNVAIEPLHYIMSKRAKENHDHYKPSLQEFLDRWSYYDQYHLVPEDFMEEMYRSITKERLETGWDNKTGRRSIDKNSSNAAQREQLLSSNNSSNGITRPKIVSPSIQQGSQDVVITVTPYRLPPRLTKGLPSEPITISIPNPDRGLQIKLRGQDLTFEPSNVLDFSESCSQTFTITGNTLGRTSLMFIKMGENAGNYVSPTLPRTKSVVVERPFMRYTFQIGFKQQQQPPVHSTPRKEKASPGIQTSVEQALLPPLRNDGNHEDSSAAAIEEEEKDQEDEDDLERRVRVINRKYTFSVETAEERMQWMEALKRLSGHVNHIRNEETIRGYKEMTSEARVAMQVLKEILLATNEQPVKKATATTVSSPTAVTANKDTLTSNNRNDVYQKYSQTMNLLLPTANIQRTQMTPQQQQALENRKSATANAIASSKTSTTTITPTAPSSTTANVVTKRGHEIVKLVVQNSMVPLVLGFLNSQIE